MPVFFNSIGTKRDAFLNTMTAPVVVPAQQAFSRYPAKAARHLLWFHCSDPVVLLVLDGITVATTNLTRTPVFLITIDLIIDAPDSTKMKRLRIHLVFKIVSCLRGIAPLNGGHVYSLCRTLGWVFSDACLWASIIFDPSAQEDVIRVVQRQKPLRESSHPLFPRVVCQHSGNLLCADL